MKTDLFVWVLQYESKIFPWHREICEASAQKEANCLQELVHLSQIGSFHFESPKSSCGIVFFREAGVISNLCIVFYSLRHPYIPILGPTYKWGRVFVASSRGFRRNSVMWAQHLLPPASRSKVGIPCGRLEKKRKITITIKSLLEIIPLRPILLVAETNVLGVLDVF